MSTNEIQLIETFGNKIDGYVQTLADKAGTGIDHFWPVLIRQQYIEGWSHLVSAIALILLFGIVFLSTHKWIKAEPDFKGFISLLSGFGLIVFLFVFFMGVTGILGQIFNPEYFALKEVAAMIK